MVGIIGYGAIVSKLAYRLYNGFGSKILYYDPYIPQDDPNVQSVNAKLVSITELMQESDMKQFILLQLKIRNNIYGKRNLL